MPNSKRPSTGQKNSPAKMNKKFWEFRNQADGQSAELLLYGDISESSWWKDDVTPKQFAEDLAALGTVDEITVRIDSGGGDVFAAENIGNQLERNSANVTVCIDGLCASAATIIACHANKVVAANDSIYMIHPVSMGICGYVDATEMRNYLKALDAIRDTITALYAKKTGRPQDEVAKLMDETSWWTSQQARDEGFVDELTDDEVEDVVVENRGGLLFVNSVGTHLPFDKAPEFVQNRLKAKNATGGFENTPPAEQPGNESHEEVTNMDEIKTVDDLRAKYPALVDQIEQAAAKAERDRIKEIEDMALPGNEKMTDEAKFTKPINAAQYAVAVMKNTKAQGGKYLDLLHKDAQESNADGIASTPPADIDPEDARETAFLNAIRKANGVK